MHGQFAFADLQRASRGASLFAANYADLVPMAGSAQEA